MLSKASVLLGLLWLGPALLGCTAEAERSPCQGLSCDGHGRCAEVDGAAVCLCDAGYVSEGTGCRPAHCASDPCLWGTCDERAGQAACACNPGYTGALCDTCAEGYHPDSLACVPDEPCSEPLCVHGVCRRPEGESPRCDCDPGFAGDSCEICAEGYHADGLRCTRDLPCDPDPCAHGVCRQDADGSERCECAPGYAGEDCGECAPGYEVRDLACLPQGAPDPCDPDPCLQGRCEVAADGSAACRCQRGWAGPVCGFCATGYHAEGGDCVADPPEDPCSPNPCTDPTRGRCRAVEGQAICLCDAGLHEDGGECVPDTTCDPATTCGGHGLCTGEGLSCECSAGYEGEHCEDCAPSYHSFGGECRPDSPCEPNPCTDEHRSVCSEQGEDAVCACDPGYQDAAGDETCRPDCITAALDCGAHARCQLVSGVAQCRCEAGYEEVEGECRSVCEQGPQDCGDNAHCEEGPAGPRCACDEGYQDGDGDGLCAPGCDLAALDCGAGGHCELRDGAAGCVCDPGHQDRDGDGECLPTCATAGLACGDGEICSDASGRAECRAGRRPPVYIAFHWHMHQPIYWPYESIVDTEREQRMGFSVYAVHQERGGPYGTWPRDAVAAGRNLPHLGAQVSFSGSLIENLSRMEAAGQGFGNWTAPWREAMGWRTANDNPRLELTAFGYHHPLMGLIDEADLRLQVQAHRVAVRRAFGQDPGRGMFPPECAFSQRMIPGLVAEGIEWVLVDNIHFDRAHVDYPFRPESNLPPPNPADARNRAETAWVQLNGLWAPSPVSSPWGYQPHWAQHVDPETGAVQRIVVVPAARYEGNEDGRGGFGALNYEAVLAQHEANNLDPEHPVLVVLHHDGDNYGGGSDGYYHGNFQAFVNWVGGQPDRFVATTIQDYLDQFPPADDDVIYVEDGSWSGADNGDPEFHKWNGDPGGDGYSPDRNSWGVVTAVKNRVLTAAALEPGATAENIVDGQGGDLAQAWHFLLNAETSCYWYWDGSADGRWDSHPTRAANQAAVFADRVLGRSGGQDPVPPTLYLPQREPYNPGRGDEPSDFTVWTYAYDVSGLARVVLRWRRDADGEADAASERYAGGEWTELVMEGRSLEARTNPLPTYKAEEFSAVIAGQREALLDYYVEAEDTRGNVARSPMMHVWVGAEGPGPGGDELWTPAAPGPADRITVWGQRAGWLHWGVDAGLNAGRWSPPPEEYWPAGTTLWNDGLAVETPLAGPDAEGRYSVELGPFDGAPVREINFVFRNADGSWTGPDRRIPIAR